MLARCMKAIGYLTDPATTPGKAFTWCERGMSGVMEKLAHDPRYLDFAGRMMERSFRAQTQTVENAERMLRTMRLPTASDMLAMRDQMRRLNDQVEALSAQLELALDALEAIKAKAEDAGPPRAE